MWQKRKERRCSHEDNDELPHEYAAHGSSSLRLFTACANDDPHEDEGGVAIALDNSQCPNVNIGHTRLFVYNTSGNLCATYDYVDAHAVASALLPLEVGHYTIAVIINADETPAETATLTALHEWVAAQEGLDPDCSPA